MDPRARWHGNSWLVVRDEVNRVLDVVDPSAMRAAAALLANRSRRWFASGQGRSGLVAQMAAMRLMHVGFDAHVVGEATAPAIGGGDGLLVVSGSGETPVTLHLAHRAALAGATLLAITSRPESQLARQASVVLAVQVPGSHQFGGSLFEQSALLLLDALILDLTAEDPDAYTVMRARHVNLE
jgi:6-phospho-3-hexuloisomerase